LTGSPASFSENFGSVEVRIRTIPAANADELGLGAAISLVDMPTLGALPAGVSRVDAYKHHACGKALVGDKLLELVERPVVQDGTLREPSLDSVPDALEIFEHHGTIRAFGLRNDLLGDTVVYILGKTKFLARKMLEESLSRTGSLLLKLGTQVPMAAADTFELGAAEMLAIGVGENFRDTKVGSEEIGGTGRLGSIGSQNKVDIQESGVGIQCQSSSSRFPPLEEMPLVVSQGQPNSDSSADSGKAHRLGILDKTEQAAVQVCAGGVERGRGLLTLSKTARHTGYRPDGVITGKPIFRLDVVVAKFVKCILSTDIFFVGDGKNIITGSSKLLQGQKQRLPLLRGWFKLAADCLDAFHTYIIPLKVSFLEFILERGASASSAS
jgi:hypothetical protein